MKKLNSLEELEIILDIQLPIEVYYLENLNYIHISNSYNQSKYSNVNLNLIKKSKIKDIRYTYTDLEYAPYFLTELPQLNSVIISCSYLRDFIFINEFKKLEYLDLTSNFIIDFDINSPELEDLNLGNNNLTSFIDSMWFKLPKLKYFYINLNKIYFFNASSIVFPKTLEAISIDYNPIFSSEYEIKELLDYVYVKKLNLVKPIFGINVCDKKYFNRNYKNKNHKRYWDVFYIFPSYH